MWIENEDRIKTDRVREYFNSFQYLDEKNKYKILAFKNGTVTVSNISQSGILSQDDADEMTWVGNKFYDLLKDAPDFRFALTGVEVGGWIEMNEILKNPIEIIPIKGFVISNDIYESIGKPGSLLPFKANYVWNPYEGEVYEKPYPPFYL